MPFASSHEMPHESKPSAAVANEPTTVSSPRHAMTEHKLRLAREQQRMMEELLSTGLVQVADLLALGFTAEEIVAAGFTLPPPAHADRTAVMGVSSHGGAEVTHDEESGAEGRRCRARKRTHDDKQGPAPTLAVEPAAPVASTSPPLSRRPATPPRTTAKVLEAAAPGTAHSPGRGCGLTEKSRAHAIAAAARPPRPSVECARTLCYDVDEEADTARASCSATGTRGNGMDGWACKNEEERKEEEEGARSARVAGQGSRVCNSALMFSGLDVAVTREIALLLTTPASDDDAAVAGQRETQAYLESRMDGNTPYM